MVRFALVACFLVACGKGDRGTPASQGSATGSGSASAAPEPGTGACAKAEQKGPLRWIEDDWASAVACAKERKLPIVLDLWAPWCHTCISMQTTVFMDPSFAAKADQFVFAALDTDKEVNAAPVGRYAASAMPTFYVIGPDEQVLARFVGAATLAEFQALLDVGARAASGGVAAADAHMLGAERALAQKDLAVAEQELTAALAAATPDWPRRIEAVYSLQLTQKKRADYLGCVKLSDANMSSIGKSAMATNFWSTAMSCAGELAKAPPAGADPAQAKRVQDRSLANLAAVLDDPKATLSLDDRAEALGYLRDGLDAYGKKDEAKATAEKLRTLLDDGYAKAPDGFHRLTYLWPRAEAYAWLERPLDLVPDYTKLAAELPKEYEPPARLGWLYLKAKKYAEAAQWTDKALALVYGPRKGRILNQRAEIAAAAGDKATERAMREQAVKLWETLPPGQQNPDQLKKARDALAALDAAGTPRSAP